MDPNHQLPMVRQRTTNPNWLLRKLPAELKHEIGKFAHLMQMRIKFPDGDLESVAHAVAQSDLSDTTAASWLSTLLDFGVRIATTEEDNFDVFTRASLAYDLKLIRRLVRIGYNINATSQIGESAVSVFANVFDGSRKDISVLRVLFQQGANNLNPAPKGVQDTHILYRIIIRTCYNDYVNEALELLLKHGAPLSRALHAVGDYPSQVPIIKLLLDAGADIEELWPDNTPLTRAAYKKIPEVVQAFVDAGANVNGAGQKYPLFSALRPMTGEYFHPYSTAATLKILCDAGAHTNVLDVHRHSVLSYALTTGYRENRFEIEETVPFVIDTLCKGGADVNFRHRKKVKSCSGARDNDTPLHFATRTRGRHESGPNKTPPEVPVECIEVLISHGANVDSQNRAGLTPLHEAVIDSNLLCARVLVKHGASMDLKDIHGQTALMLAQKMNPRSEEMVAFLMEQQSRDNIP